MIRKSLSILFLILSVLTLYAEKTNYLYSFNSDLNEGISQLSVMTIYQDSRGYLWFATKNGLNRFNGKESIIGKTEMSRACRITPSPPLPKIRKVTSG